MRLVAESRGSTATPEHGQKKNLFSRIALFYRQVVAEMRKVVWPTATQLRQYFVVVLVFVLLVILYVSSLDLLFGWGLLQIFG